MRASALAVQRRNRLGEAQRSGHRSTPRRREVHVLLCAGAHPCCPVRHSRGCRERGSWGEEEEVGAAVVRSWSFEEGHEGSEELHTLSC